MRTKAKLGPGKMCQCPTCSEYFSTVSNFDRHRVGKHGSKVCVDPESVGLVIGVDIDNIAIWVKSNMNAGGLSVRVAAKEIGISPTTLQRIVNGNIPDIKTLEKVMEWLGCRLAFYSID